MKIENGEVIISDAGNQQLSSIISSLREGVRGIKKSSDSLNTITTFKGLFRENPEIISGAKNAKKIIRQAELEINKIISNIKSM